MILQKIYQLKLVIQYLFQKLIEDLIIIIEKNLKAGNINLKNVGSFRLKNKKDRIGRNPKTNEKFLIKSRKSVALLRQERY